LRLFWIPKFEQTHSPRWNQKTGTLRWWSTHFVRNAFGSWRSLIITRSWQHVRRIECLTGRIHGHHLCGTFWAAPITGGNIPRNGGVWYALQWGLNGWMQLAPSRKMAHSYMPDVTSKSRNPILLIIP
jgi:hypothetical protein